MKKVNKSVIDAETIFAYGADGTTGQIEYHQASSSGSVIDDHSLFTVIMTSFQLRSKLDGEILWKNPTPQSFRSRRLFSKPHDLAKILELDDELVSSLSTILAALNCHEHLDFEKFGSFCHDTYSLFISKYKWFNMPLFIKFFVIQKTLL